MKVPSLVDFYNNQNRLAVEAASQTASNRTNMAIADKRLQQEQQLERFRQMMENMRQARSQSSAEGMQKAQIMAQDAQTRLGRDFSTTQQAESNKFQLELQKRYRYRYR